VGRYYQGNLPSGRPSGAFGYAKESEGMDSSGFGWRELMIVAAVVAGVYLVVALMALARLRRRPAPTPAIEPSTSAEAGVVARPATPGKTWDHPFLTPAPLPEESPIEVDLVMDELSLPPSVPQPVTPFAATLGVTELEAEVRQLRAEVAAMRQELSELKEARRVSPLYADAAALAHRGFDARGVAEECGISVAEAELVLAMSRDEKMFDSEVEDGADGNKHDATS
jgi:hypothetical protein